MKNKESKNSEGVNEIDRPRCVEVFEAEISNSSQFCRAMSLLMSDLAAHRITPQISNAICNAGGKLLKVKEMEQRFGVPQTAGGRKTISFIES